MKRAPRRLIAKSHTIIKKSALTIKTDFAALTLMLALENLIVFIAIVQLAVVGLNGLRHDHPILGLRLEGQIVGRPLGDPRRQTEGIIRDYENQGIVIRAANYNGTVSLRQLGVSIDPEKAYSAILKVGRIGSAVDKMTSQDIAFTGGQNLRLQNIGFQESVARAYLKIIDQQIARPPTNAYFTLKDQKVVIHPDVDGQAINTGAALTQLRQASPTRSQSLELPISVTPAQVSAKMLNPLSAQVQAIVARPLVIAAGESREMLSPEQLLQIITPKTVSSQNDTTARLSFDEDRLNATVNTVVERAVADPKPTIVSGGKVLQPGVAGIHTKDNQSLSRILAALIARQNGSASPDIVEIPLVTVEPPIIHQASSAPAANPNTRTGTGHVRLTFDDGPGGVTEQVLDILKRYNVRATFYVVGQNVPRYHSTMQRMVREGHQVANHTFSHANLTTLSRAGIEQELASTQVTIREACGVTPTAFRPPYGAQNQTVREVAAAMGMSVDMWSVDPRDWTQPGGSVIVQRVLAGISPGAVVLMHSLNQQSADALPGIIEGVRAQGYTLE